MSHTNLVLGANWHSEEWPESVDVMHEGVGYSRRYVPERTCEFIPFIEDDGSIFVENYSECDAAVLSRCEFNYCPNCGAKVVR